LTILRIQAGDFQDSKQGMQGNLSKLETIVKHANAVVASGETLAGVDIVGDWYDQHNSELVQKIQQQKMQELEQKNPEASKLIQNYFGFQQTLQEKYKTTFQRQEDYQKLSKEDLEKIQEISKAMQENPDAIQCLMPDYLQASKIIYNEQKKILTKLDDNIKIYSVRGNCDTNCISDVLESVRFIDMEDKLTEEGAFTILGANNTNIPAENPYQGTDYGIEYDDDSDLNKSVAYQKYNLAKTGKKANIMMLHGPPADIEMRGSHDKGMGVGIPQLIKEHKPGLVECGHFHKAAIDTIDGVVYARSSPYVFYEHEFSDEGVYLGSAILEYV